MERKLELFLQHTNDPEATERLRKQYQIQKALAELESDRNGPYG